MLFKLARNAAASHSEKRFNDRSKLNYRKTKRSRIVIIIIISRLARYRDSLWSIQHTTRAYGFSGEFY